MFWMEIVEKVKTHILCSVTFFLKTVPFVRWCAKVWYSQTAHRWHCNTAHTLCMLDNYGYKTQCLRCVTVLDAEDDGSVILWNVENSPSGTVSIAEDLNLHSCFQIVVSLWKIFIIFLSQYKYILGQHVTLGTTAILYFFSKLVVH